MRGATLTKCRGKEILVQTKPVRLFATRLCLHVVSSQHLYTYYNGSLAFLSTMYLNLRHVSSLKQNIPRSLGFMGRASEDGLGFALLAAWIQLLLLLWLRTVAGFSDPDIMTTLY